MSSLECLVCARDLLYLRDLVKCDIVCGSCGRLYANRMAHLDCVTIDYVINRADCTSCSMCTLDKSKMHIDILDIYEYLVQNKIIMTEKAISELFADLIDMFASAYEKRGKLEKAERFRNDTVNFITEILQECCDSDYILSPFTVEYVVIKVICDFYMQVCKIKIRDLVEEIKDHYYLERLAMREILMEEAEEEAKAKANDKKSSSGEEEIEEETKTKDNKDNKD